MTDSKSPSTEAESKSASDAVNGNSPNSAPDPAAITADYEQKLQESEARVLRVQAEMENFRRRTRREMDEQLKYASLPLISGIIEVVDNLTRALSAAESQSGTALVDGVRMVQNQLEQTLEKNGCKRIVSVNAPFDPNIHSALQMQASDSVPANIVIAETRSGYQLYDRVVRPALVIISTGPVPTHSDKNK